MSYPDRKRATMGTVMAVLIALWLPTAQAGKGHSVAQAMQISISSLEQLQHKSVGHGLSIRVAFRYNSTDSVGIIARATAVPSDYYGYYGITLHGGINVRHLLLQYSRHKVTPFVGGILGLGVWTACVYPERCGGYGPSLGAEMGASWQIFPQLKLVASLQADAHSSWFAGEDIISMLSLYLGAEY